MPYGGVSVRIRKEKEKGQREGDLHVSNGGVHSS